MSRPQTKYDRFPGFLAAATADTATARLAAIDRALAPGIGHKLFTVLVVNWDQRENQRCYSSLPDAYQGGGILLIEAHSDRDVRAEAGVESDFPLPPATRVDQTSRQNDRDGELVIDAQQVAGHVALDMAAGRDGQPGFQVRRFAPGSPTYPNREFNFRCEFELLNIAISNIYDLGPKHP